MTHDVHEPMQLDPEGIEYAHWPVTAPDLPFDAGPLQIAFSFEDYAVWHDAEWNDDKNDARLLVSGPDAPSSTAVRLPLGRTYTKARLADTPEVPIRSIDSYIEVK